MKPVVVPSAGGALVAMTSLLFYTLFGRLYGSATLAWVILLQASVAVVQMAIVPQAWLYVLGSATDAEREARYAMAMRVELLAGLAGAILIFAIASLPYRLFQASPASALFMFGSLWVTGSTSHQGYFRARAQWPRFAAWILMAAAIRLALIVLLPRSGAFDMPGPSDGGRTELVAIYFFFPDLCRFVAINLPQIIARRASPETEARSATIAGALRGIGHNWLYDLGSAIVENGDKILVGALLDPILLVVYFFARRIGSALSLPIEPAYAEIHRRLAGLPTIVHAARQQRVYFLFLAATIPAALALTGLVALIAFIAPMALPDGLVRHLCVLLALVAIECGVAVNRWSRYVAQRGWMSGGLLAFRLALRLLFGLAIFELVRTGIGPGTALVLAYALAWAIETYALLWLMRTATRASPRAEPAS